MSCVNIAGAWHAGNFSYTYLPTSYSLMLNTESYTKMQSYTTNPPCYQTCEISANDSLIVGKTSLHNLI